METDKRQFISDSEQKIKDQHRSEPTILQTKIIEINKDIPMYGPFQDEFKSHPDEPEIDVEHIVLARSATSKDNAGTEEAIPKDDDIDIQENSVTEWAVIPDKEKPKKSKKRKRGKKPKPIPQESADSSKSTSDPEKPTTLPQIPESDQETTQETVIATSDDIEKQKKKKRKPKKLKDLGGELSSENSELDEEDDQARFENIIQTVKQSSDKTLDKFGKVLLSQTEDGTVNMEQVLKKLKKKSPNLSDQEVDLLLASYKIAGFFSLTDKGKLKRTKRAKNIERLGSSEVRSAIAAREAMSYGSNDDVKIRSFKDIRESYEGIEDDYVDDVELETTDGNHILFLSEVLMGNNATDIKFLEKTLKEVKKLPLEMKPNAIVVSGLLEGSNKFRQKDKRLGRQQNLDQQLQSSKVVLDYLRKMGVPVIYVISNDDRGIAHDGTVLAMSALKNYEKPLRDSEKNFKNYHDVDQMKYDDAWDTHYRFQLEVAFEYMLRNGRRLRSADEISDATSGKIRMEEYLLLWEAYQSLSLGNEVPDYVRKIINIDHIPLPGREREDFIVTDGLDLTLKDKSKKDTQEILHLIREGIVFGDTSTVKDPTAPAEAIFKQLNVEGESLPDTVVVMDQQQAMGIGNRNGWIISTGGLTQSSEALKQKTSVAKSGKRAAHRHATSRRRLEKPSMEIIEAEKDRLNLTVLNRKLLEKADASSERVTVALYNDWQLGSITARPDLQAKWHDFVFSQQLQEGPLYLFTDGDIVHGRNYKGMPEENAPTKLIRIEDQLKMAKRIITRGAHHISNEDLKNLQMIGVVPGNHEYDSFYRDTGTAFADYIASGFREFLAYRGMPEETIDNKVKAYERVRSSAGDHLQTWTAIEKDIGGYGAVVQHKIVNKGAKQGGGKAPVYQAPILIEGLGSDGSDIDLGLFAHWHHPQYLVAGDKLMLIAPSIAGWSGFEFGLGYKPVMGGMTVKLGGGLPPQVTFYNKQFLDNYQIQEGVLSNKSLRKAGFKDDRHFDPAKHGMYDRAGALQKYMWAQTEEIVDSAHSFL